MRVSPSLVLLVAALGGCYDMSGINQWLAAVHSLEQPGSVVGGVTVHPPAGEAYTVMPRACRSGQPNSFRGVDLASGGDDPTLIRLAVDPIEGTRLRVEHVRGAAPWILDASRCTMLTEELRPTGVAINRVTLVEGHTVFDCTAADGTRFTGDLRFERCHTSGDVDAVATALAEGRPIAALPAVPDADPPATLPPAVRALRVAVSTRVVGGTVHGESPAHAQRMCLAGDRDFVTGLGWTAVAPGEAHDLDLEFACTGHVQYRSIGALTAIELPAADGPSLRVRAGERELLSIGPAARSWRCEGAGERAAREQACGERVGRYTSARLARMLADSTELAGFAARR